MQSENKTKGNYTGLTVEGGEIKEQQFDDSLWALPDAQFSTPRLDKFSREATLLAF